MKKSFHQATSIALVGLPGAGKTTLAQALQKNIQGLRLVSRDLIRDAMFKPCLYTNEEKSAAFESMRLAQKAIWLRSESTVMDGICFSSEEVLRTVEQDAGESGVRFIPLYCVCPVEVAIRRVEADFASGNHPAKDRNGALVSQVNDTFFDVPNDIPKIDMSNDIADCLEQALIQLEVNGTTE